MASETAAAHRVDASPPGDALDRILADVDPREPYDWTAELQLVLYEDAEPIGLIAGRHEPWPDGERFLHLSHFMFRPAWRGRGLWYQFGPSVVAYCRAHGLRAITCGLAPEDPPEVRRAAIAWGFTRYATDANHVEWLVAFLPSGDAPAASAVPWAMSPRDRYKEG